MFYYVHEKLQFSNSEVIVTLIVILFIVSVCMNIPLIRQDDHKNRFSNAGTIFFFLSKLKLVYVCLYQYFLDAPEYVDFVQSIYFVGNLPNSYCLELKKAIKVSLL